MIRKVCSTLTLALLLSSLVAAMPQTEGQDAAPEKKAEKSAAGEKSAAEKSPPERGSGVFVQQSEMGPPVELRHVSVPIKLKMTDNSRAIFESIGEQAGISMLFDPDFVPRPLSVDLNSVSFEDALKIVAFESKSFWRPVTSSSILVASDNPTKHKELEQQIIKTFYLPNAWTNTDLQDMVNMLRVITQLERVQQFVYNNAIVARGTPDQMIVAQRLIDDFVKRKHGEYRVEFRISELDGEKKLNSRTYTLRVESRVAGRLRVGSRVPIQTEADAASGKDKAAEKDKKESSSIQYMDVGANIDCQVTSESEGTVGLRIDMDLSTLTGHEQAGNENAVPYSGNPVVQQVRMETQALLEPGKPTAIGNFDDPISKHTFQVEATATRLRE